MGSRQVVNDYRTHFDGFLRVRDERVRRRVNQELDAGLLWPEPWLSLNPAFAEGGDIQQPVADGVLHPACAEIFQVGGRCLHQHQRDAMATAQSGACPTWSPTSIASWAKAALAASGRSWWMRQPAYRAGGLRFLVLDEPSTYRSRQGTDLAMLVRQVRDACESPSKHYVGTSAPLTRPGTLEEQRVAVAGQHTWYGMTTTEVVVIYADEEPIRYAIAAARLCDHAVSWDGRTRYPAPVHLAYKMDKDHPDYRRTIDPDDEIELDELKDDDTAESPDVT